jgi:transcriptional regulator with PAS, ATPase and Fis domain
MKEKILFCWLGTTDLNAAKEVANIGVGPVAQAAKKTSYKEIVLLNNWERSLADSYRSWLCKKTSSNIIIKQVSLSNPTDFGGIYKAATKTISEKIKEHGSKSNLAFHLSPGTPAMAAVWILISKTIYPAELIESSRDHGVHTVSIPFDISADFIPDLLRKSDKALETLAAGLSEKAPAFNKIICQSDVMKKVIFKARLAAPRSIPVLLEGESGTGKELFAQAIHNSSPRKNEPFVVMNCGAIPASLIESELFGHEKGAFTGASQMKRGYFEQADKGTIFLDEIGELPKNMQVKLLRTVQEKEITRVGSIKNRKIDIRIIAATNRNLIDDVSNSLFREDLFYRLAVAVIKLPPLRDRTGDISQLIKHFLKQINKEYTNNHKKLSASAKNIMLQHSWPGNVRELQNTMTRAALWAMDNTIAEEDIQEALFQIPDKNEHILNQSIDKGINLPKIMEKVAVHYLKRGLAKNHKNKTATAKTLGLSSYQTLTNWLKKYNLE